LIHKGFQHIKSYYFSNGYPDWFIDKQIKIFLKKRYKNTPSKTSKKGRLNNDTDAQETSRASKYCRQVISIPVSLCFQKCVDCAKARAKIIFLKRCLKEDIHHKCIGLNFLLEHQRRKVSTNLQEEIQTAPKARDDPSHVRGNRLTLV